MSGSQSSGGRRIFGVGIPTLMVALTSLALTAFAALSLVSAGADLRMTKRLAESARLYAIADARAEAILAEIDAALMPVYEDTIAVSYTDAYARGCEAALAGFEGVRAADGECRYIVTVDERHALEVALALKRGENSRFEITAWQLIDTKQWEEHYEGLPVWTGEGAMP